MLGSCWYGATSLVKLHKFTNLEFTKQVKLNQCPASVMGAVTIG